MSLSWLGRPARNPAQTHGVNESDCEVVRLDDGRYLATTIDSISEEIAVGLYRDPYTMGWVTAQASLSDLAAVGGKPVGLLFSAQWARGASDEFKSEVARGLSDALAQAGTFLLGGDSGSAVATVLSGVAIGHCDVAPPSRKGMKPGDALCVVGHVGRGPALAFRLLRGEPDAAFAESAYRPSAKLKEGALLAQGLATSMMDTSDGLLSTLDTLSELNQVGFDLDWNRDCLDSLAVQYCQAREIPLSMLWIGEHGDFDLVVTIAPEKVAQAKAKIPNLHVIGQVTDRALEARLRCPDGVTRRIEFSLARSLQAGHSLDPKKLSEMLWELSKAVRGYELP